MSQTMAPSVEPESLTQRQKPDTTLRCIYSSDTRHEVLLLDWWRQITLAEDMDRTLALSLHAPLAFCAHFAQPDLLRFCIDEQGIWFAFWAEPLLAGAVQGLWIRPTYRKSRVSLDCLLRALSWAFDLYPVLLSTSIQPSIVRQLVYLGYTAPHHIPYLWPNAAECLIQHQTRQHWKDRKPLLQRDKYRGSLHRGRS